MLGFRSFVLRDVLLPLVPEATDNVFARVFGVLNHVGTRMLQLKTEKKEKRQEKEKRQKKN